LTSDFTSTPTFPPQNTNSPAPLQNVIQNADPQQNANHPPAPLQNVIQNSNQMGPNSSRSGSPGNNKDQGHFFN
jgi:hypothetical protein